MHPPSLPPHLPDPSVLTSEYAEADRAQRMRDRGHSHWIEGLIAAVVGVAIFGWIAWVFLF